jgi:hypothetical protein
MSIAAKGLLRLLLELLLLQQQKPNGAVMLRQQRWQRQKQNKSVQKLPLLQQQKPNGAWLLTKVQLPASSGLQRMTTPTTT